ncbi:CoA-transferase family III domain-containing protein [Radiomyces spectabilis]|uniref:CoA-transferase family III domain-containing protein n=1 Tax=Radiomyces spectabilis TaxID=64574 RepID=UPI00221F8CA5|nr:CoA-transferase family III domain-containing protein [Radiomyces spectabilis]KAI8371713.1 CoA-transferase family III domain-containing protein [Radiomyces spectabilis]
MTQVPLAGIVVFELAGLAPCPFAGMILSDFGANVIRVDRPHTHSTDILARNKRSIALDLKKPAAVEILRAMLLQADVLLDPFRPGVMEKLGLGPTDLLKKNPRLVYARLSGFGQQGSASAAAGHDINYLAIAGVLSMMGRHDQPPFFPMNVLADFAGGGLMCALGVLMALFSRTKTGKGQVLDANLTAGTAYLTTFPYLMQKHGLLWEGPRGSNMLDGGAHFYEVYKTKDGEYMAVGAIEPPFYAALLKGLGLDPESLPHQMDSDEWPKMKKTLAAVFASKTQAEWTRVFDGTDACVTPVIHFNKRVADDETNDLPRHHWPRQAAPPSPAPILSRTPARPVQLDDTSSPFLTSGQHTIEILSEFGYKGSAINDLLSSKTVFDASQDQGSRL